MKANYADLARQADSLCASEIFSEWETIDFLLKEKAGTPLVEKVEYLLEYASVKEFVANLFSSKKSVEIVSGCLGPLTFGDHFLVSSIAKMIKQGIKFDFIIGNEIILKNNKNNLFDYLYQEVSAANENLQVRLYSGVPPVHYNIIDGQNVCYEYPHHDFAEFRRRVYGKNCSQEMINTLRGLYKDKTILINKDNLDLLQEIKRIEAKEMTKELDDLLVA